MTASFAKEYGDELLSRWTQPTGYVIEEVPSA